MDSALGQNVPFLAPEARPGTTVVEKLQEDANQTSAPVSSVTSTTAQRHPDTSGARRDDNTGYDLLPQLAYRRPTPHPKNTEVPDDSTEHSAESAQWQSAQKRRAIALRDFTAEAEGGSTLAVRKFDILELGSSAATGWFEASIHGKICRVRSEYVSIVDWNMDPPWDNPNDGLAPCADFFIRGTCDKGGSCTFSHNLKTRGIPLPKLPPQRIDSVAPPPISQAPAAAYTSSHGPTQNGDSDSLNDYPIKFTVDRPIENPNYGPRTRDYIPSRSAPPHQAREDRQPTPPVPSPAKETPKVNPDLSEEGSSQRNYRQLKLREGLFDAGKGELFYTLTRREDDTLPKTSVLNIATLQHMALHQIQYDIACYVEYMYRTSQFWMHLRGFPPLTDLMNSYCEAVRNLDFMTQCALRGYEEDPFLMKSSRALERSTMETIGLVPNHVLPSGPLPIPHDANRPLLREMGRNEANKAAHEKKRLLRFSMAALGGLLLVVPTIIMATTPGLVSSLVTTCVFMLLFAVLVAWRTDLTPNEVLGTTAAYAAVLVVFVGTSLTHRGQ